MFLDKLYIVLVQVFSNSLLFYVLKLVVVSEMECDYSSMCKMFFSLVFCIYSLMFDVESYLLFSGK